MTRLLRHEWHTAVYDPETGLGVWARLVCCALVEHANREGVCWPSLPEIGRWAGCTSRMTVLKGLAELEKAGLLQISRRSGRVNRYRLVLPEAVSREHTRPSDGRVPVHEPVHEPVHHVDPNQVTSGTKEQVRANAQSLVAYFVDQARAVGADPPDGLRGRWARELAKLAGRYSDEQLRAGIDAMLAKRLVQPSVLETVLFELQLPPRQAARAEHPVDRHFREAFGVDAADLNHQALAPREDGPT